MSSSLIHADIFFFITSVVVIVFGILICIALIYIVRILKNAASLSDTVKKEGDAFAEDFSELREVYMTEGKKLAYFLQFLTKIIGAKAVHTRATRARPAHSAKKSADADEEIE